MPTLESVRGKIESAGELLSVVKTMKAMAAVNIRQCDNAVKSLAAYNRTVELGLQIVLRSKMREIRLAAQPIGTRLGAGVFGSKQGLVGQFNQRVADYALGELDRIGVAEERRALLATGIVSGHLEDAGQRVERALQAPWSVAGITPLVQEMLVIMDEWRSTEHIDQIVLFYNQPGPGASYAPNTLRLLPIDPRLLSGLRERDWPGNPRPIFDADWTDLFAALIRQYMFIALYRAYAESLASENAHRLASMQSAEKNIEERIDDLRTQYNQIRQSAITEELLDIVAGYEALTGADASD
jgi:F-type H+-transporting ATPase subunit gamma